MELSKRVKSNLTTPKTILDLPSDLLLLILSRLDQKDLQSLSLVSKPFLHLSNRFIRKLTFKTLPNDRSFKKIFTRFPSVNQITLNTNRVVRALTAISKSQLNLQALIIANCPIYPKKHQMLSLSGKLKIKSLVLFDVIKFKAAQVVEFIRLFPLLEELYVGFSYEKWDDAGIVSLSLIVPNLRNIDLSRSDIWTCPSFSLFPASNLLLAETVSACENIHHLSINLSLIRDAYTMTGLSAMLSTFLGLTKLSICLPLSQSDKFIDKKMSELVKSLPMFDWH